MATLTLGKRQKSHSAVAASVSGKRDGTSEQSEGESSKGFHAALAFNLTNCSNLKLSVVCDHSLYVFWAM